MARVRGALLLLLLGGACAAAAPPARAAPLVRLQASLTPERLGHGTTLGFGFDVLLPAGQDPVPLTRIDVLYPANLGIATSGIGLASCTAATLEASGPQACPEESLMGRGSAITEIPLGPGIIREHATVTILKGPVEHERISLLFYVEGASTVDAQLVFSGLLEPAPAPFGGDVITTLAPVPTFPEAPDVALVRLRYTLGPRGLVYHERRHGKLIAYEPMGILLPPSCPRGGFPFGARFVFLDGGRASATTRVACPGRG